MVLLGIKIVWAVYNFRVSKIHIELAYPARYKNET